MPPYFRQRCRVCSETSSAFAASPGVLPSESICSAVRSLRMICSGVCLCLFTCFGPPLPIVAGGKDSQTGRTHFRGSGQADRDGCKSFQQGPQDLSDVGTFRPDRDQSEKVTDMSYREPPAPSDGTGDRTHRVSERRPSPSGPRPGADRCSVRPREAGWRQCGG